ncbi:hypothetical protein [uncultured Roseivirga sp.]|uniref:hypothetical protein n=1 Tax=uncultured Roseivirga sp. TaxID=543088 RepID=UPI0030D9CFA5|tara:strand:+ start:1232 stop:2020 length:789 start_codon:yes stop_codon:yes gene_type:complete
MITIKFKGWFQCRLATDPDPADEPRGISGYMRALPGEPDLDRIIRFHNPLVVRSHTSKVGVFVTELYKSNTKIEKHPLIGAKVNLENNPIFHGWNSIIADDGEEPIIPMDISISNDDFRIYKKHRHDNYEYPFEETRAVQVIPGANDLLEQVGIYDEFSFVKRRIALLEKDLTNVKDLQEKYIITERIKWLKAGISYSFFRFRMNYNIKEMKGPLETINVNDIIYIDDETEWYLNFWMGAWDADAQNGFVSGILQLKKANLL